MKLATIWLTNKCNYGCYYCPSKKWLQPPDFEYACQNGEEEKCPDCVSVSRSVACESAVSRNRNDLLIPWMDRYLDPGEWLVELTGGEPGLYPEIGDLVPELNKRGYRGVVKTNGSLPIPKSDGFVRVAAWHQDRPFPEHYDVILIIKNPGDDWPAKVRRCRDGGVPYRTCTFNPAYKGETTEKDGVSLGGHEPSKITEYMYVNCFGQIIPCYGFNATPAEGATIRDMHPPRTVKNLPDLCPMCVHTHSVTRFMPDDVLGQIDRDHAEWLRGKGEAQWN